MASPQAVEIPSSVLIIGSGVFGLSTAYSLSNNPLFKNAAITLIDRQPFPASDGSSIDTSRVIRADYASPPYARLATHALTRWRTTFAPTYYHETGLCVTASGPEQEYVSSSLANVQAIGTDRVEVLNSPDEIRRVCGLPPAEKDESFETGTMGYVNWNSGWADAEGAMRWLRNELEKLDRVKFITATVSRLLINHTTNTVSGVIIKDSTSTSTSTLNADLTILAAGAWTPALIDLRGICKSTGQPLVYISLSAQDQTALRKNPTILNLSSGLFIIPPSHRVLKIARHGHGYANPTTISHPEKEDAESITVSLPYTHVDDPLQEVPHEAKRSLRNFLAQLHPSLCHSRFVKQRICWYTDTRSGDFLISYHPQYKGLFVATGGSGHAFKFLPVIGDSIVECVLGNTPEDFRGKWEWPAERVPEELWEGDGSRGGPVGMLLSEEMAKTHSSKL